LNGEIGNFRQVSNQPHDSLSGIYPRIEHFVPDHGVQGSRIFAVIYKTASGYLRFNPLILFIR